MNEVTISTPRPALEHIIPQPGLNTVMVNERVTIHDDPETGWRRVVVGGVPFLSFQRDDQHSIRFVCVQLRLKGLAQQLELSRAFGHDRVTQHRWEKRFERDGLAGLTPYRPQGRPVSIPGSIEQAIVALHGLGFGIRRIAARLGLAQGVVRGVYERFGLEPHTVGEQLVLLDSSSKEGGGGWSIGTDETPESTENEVEAGAGWDGLLRPEYSTEKGVSFAGVMLALPVLSSHRVIEVFKEVYRHLSLIPVYGLETLVSLLIFMALWRIKRVEQLKGYSPVDLGKALGLPRVPEVRTVRRKLGLLAVRGEAREAMLKLAEVRLEQEENLIGYLYVDGHVREYSGKHDLAKGYSMLRHVPVRATTDVWANDRQGDPVFVVTSEINEGLTQMLKPVLRQARELAGEEQRITVIFDRGGWSPQLFVDLIEDGYHLITYRKGRRSEIAEDEFETRVLKVDGREVIYRLSDEPQTQVGQGKLKWSDGIERPLFLRQVTKLCDTGHQTQVLTSRSDLKAEEVLWQMFARWRQENFFKYMRQEFAIDGLVEYGATEVNPKLERPNPERAALDAEIKALRTTIERLQGQRCELVGDPTAANDAPQGFERFVPKNHKEHSLRMEIQELKLTLQELEVQRDDLPEKVSAGDLERLKPERKLLMDSIKAAAYRVETELARTVAPFYSRSDDEGRKLIAAALSSSADIEVSEFQLRVTLAPQSSPHRSSAIDALCASLNKHRTIVPGTSLRLVLACQQNPASDVA